MEGFPLSLERLDERMKTAHARIRSNHDRIDKVERKQGTQGESLVEIKGQLRDLKEDFGEMKSDMKWIKRGLFGAIAVGLTLNVGIAALIVQAAS